MYNKDVNKLTLKLKR